MSWLQSGGWRRSLALARCWRPLIVAGAVLWVTLGSSEASGAESSANQPASASAAATSELREWFELWRSTQADGPALKPLLPGETILSISTHLNPETAQRLVERLSDPRTLGRLGVDRPTVNQLIEGLRLVTPLLDEIEPQVQLIVARPSFVGVKAVPEVRLPAVGLVFRPRDASRAKRMLLSAYLLAMRQANETARAEGRPTLRLDSRRRGSGFYAASTFRLPDDPAPELVGLADYNLSPSIAVVGDRMMLASNRALILDLVDSASAETGDPLVPESQRIDLGLKAGMHLVVDNGPALLSYLSLRDRSQVFDRSFDRAQAAVQWSLEQLPSGRVTLRFKSGLPRWLARRGA